MNPTLFNTLPPQQQHKRLLSKGVYLAGHKTSDREALLFRLNGFFVEVCFENECDDVLYTRHFDDASKLEPYWQHATVSRPVVV